MRNLIVCFGLVWLSLFGIAEACVVSGNDWSPQLNEALQSLKQGEYQNFKSTIGVSIRFDENEVDELLANLKNYAPKGFRMCRELMRVDVPPLATKVVFEFSNGDFEGIYFYAFLLDGELKYRSGIIKFFVSTELDSVLKHWSNPQ